MARTLICGHCGGPLPKPTGEPWLTCSFCDTTSSLQTGELEEKRPGPSRHDRIRAATEALVADEELPTVLAQASPAQGFSRVVERHFGDLCDAEVLTNVVFALVREHHAETGTNLLVEPGQEVVVARIAQSYIKALGELRKQREAELLLPFLYTNASGPVHFRRVVTVEKLAALAQIPASEPIASSESPSEPIASSEPPSEPDAAAGEVKKPSIWKRLFARS